MEHSELLDTIRYERVLQVLEEEGAKSPRLQYDGTRKAAILFAVPSPLHGEMVGQLLGKIAYEVKMMPGLDASTKRHLSSTIRNTRDTGDTSTTRNGDSALRYLTREETGPMANHTSMIAVEVGLSQTYPSLRALYHLQFLRSAAESELRFSSSKLAVANGHQPNTTRQSGQ
ncbi:hypothetical protein V1517DRAFT_341855 [Lipomyces orientalis]|uniref:Uncharacterized protein n=1 Tax=Lipomyces orientalis TaxID=1233043 RepID=A0ACC3TDK9_9ASCO